MGWEGKVSSGANPVARFSSSLARFGNPVAYFEILVPRFESLVPLLPVYTREQGGPKVARRKQGGPKVASREQCGRKVARREQAGPTRRKRHSVAAPGLACRASTTATKEQQLVEVCRSFGRISCSNTICHFQSGHN